MDVLRLLCWCQNVRPDDLSSISTETERENLITLGLIKRHQRSDTLLLTNSGRAFLQAALEGDVPNLTLSYHDAAIERRVRLSSLMMTAHHAGINVFTITANSLAEPSTLFITAITRSRGHNPWGSARVGAIAHLGSTYYAVHYIYSGIGRMAVNDELAAFHNHTNFGKDTQRAFLFAGASGGVGYRGIRSGELFRLYAEWRARHRFRCGKRCARLSNGPSRAEYGIPPFGGDLRRGRPRRARRVSFGR